MLPQQRPWARIRRCGRRNVWLTWLALIAFACLPLPGLASDRDALQAALSEALSRPGGAGVETGKALTFIRNPEVVARERGVMLARIADQGGSDSGLYRAVESGRMLRTFDELLRRHGYSPDDLGDVLAAYLVLAWEVVNEADASRQPEGIRAVRRQLGPALVTLPHLAGLDNEARQVRAQRTSYMAMVATLNYQAFKAARDDARLSALKEEVADQVRTSAGIDLRRYTLVEGGLVPR